MNEEPSRGTGGIGNGSCCGHRCPHEEHAGVEIGAPPEQLGDHRIELSVSGISCAGEAAPLAARFERIPGVSEAMVNPITERAVVQFDPRVCHVAHLTRVLEQRGLEGVDRLARWHAPIWEASCPMCLERFEAAVGDLAGVERVVANPDECALTVEYVPSRTDEAALHELLVPDGVAARADAST